MYTTILALALFGAAPADTPITPIDETLVTLATTLDEGVSACTAASDVGAAIDELAVIGGAEAGVLFKEMAVGYFTDIFEDGLGPDQALTAEAETFLESWIIDCLG